MRYLQATLRLLNLAHSACLLKGVRGIDRLDDRAQSIVRARQMLWRQMGDDFLADSEHGGDVEC